MISSRREMLQLTGVGLASVAALSIAGAAQAQVREEAENEPVTLLRKGITRAEDTVAAVKAGASAIQVSNHGGRALDGTPAAILQEGLTILAWIALWRPGELLLYEWYPFTRDATVFGKLERAAIQVIAETKEIRR